MTLLDIGRCEEMRRLNGGLILLGRRRRARVTFSPGTIRLGVNRCKLGGGEDTEAAVGARLVVVAPPIFDDLPSIRQAGEPVLVQADLPRMPGSRTGAFENRAPGPLPESDPSIHQSGRI